MEPTLTRRTVTATLITALAAWFVFSAVNTMLLGRSVSMILVPAGWEGFLRGGRFAILPGVIATAVFAVTLLVLLRPVVRGLRGGGRLPLFFAVWGVTILAVFLSKVVYLPFRYTLYGSSMWGFDQMLRESQYIISGGLWLGFLIGLIGATVAAVTYRADRGSAMTGSMPAQPGDYGYSPYGGPAYGGASLGGADAQTGQSGTAAGGSTQHSGGPTAGFGGSTTGFGASSGGSEDPPSTFPAR